jgi:hypothetical protein
MATYKVKKPYTLAKHWSAKQSTCDAIEAYGLDALRGERHRMNDSCSMTAGHCSTGLCDMSHLPPVLNVTASIVHLYGTIHVTSALSVKDVTSCCLFVNMCRNIEAREICTRLIDTQSFEIFETGVASERDLYQGPDGSITVLSAAQLRERGFDIESYIYSDGAVMFTTVGAPPNVAPSYPQPQAKDIDIYLKCYLRAKV